MNSYIKEIGVFLPGDPISNEDFAAMYKGEILRPEMIRTLFGGKYRYISAPDVQCSDLAVNAAKAFLKEEEKQSIDLLIFSSASADLIEPATANIVQEKLGLTCPVFDVKNACNSFISAMQIADAMIKSRMYKNILIVSGEKPSDTIRFDIGSKEKFKENIASISFGDGGAAMWLSTTKENTGIAYSRFLTMGEYWNLSTILGGGSMYPFDPDKNYFKGETAKLIDVLKNSDARQFAKECFDECPWEKEEIDLLITHQIATHFYDRLAKTIDFPLEKMHMTFDKYANTASTSMPIALFDAIQNGKAKRGDKIMLLGVAAGVSVGVIFLTL